MCTRQVDFVAAGMRGSHMTTRDVYSVASGMLTANVNARGIRGGIATRMRRLDVDARSMVCVSTWMLWCHMRAG